MTQMKRLLETSTSMLGPTRVEAIAGTSKLARDGHVVVMSGMDTSAFNRSGTILWGHNPDKPVGIPVSCKVDRSGDLRVVIDFAPEGTSECADEVRALVKAGIVRNLSIGFDPIDMEPLDPRNPRGGQRILRSELLEVSFVSVPADAGAVVTARAGGRSGPLTETERDELQSFRDHARRQRAASAMALRYGPAELEEIERLDRKARAAKLSQDAPTNHSFEARQRALRNLSGK